MTEPDFAQLHAFAAVVDAGSMDAAARVLHLSPSAVSLRVKALERAAGQVLLRRARPVGPTAAGEPYLRLARQVRVLADEVADASRTWPTVSLAVPGDALSTWVLAALGPLAQDVVLDLRRADQDHSAPLLRDGSVMAAITTQAEPVQGCSVRRLGAMRYRPMASPQLVDQWFSDGVDEETLARAPMLDFDRTDDLQDRYLRTRCSHPVEPPRHHVPATAEYAEALRAGWGWGMLPEQQAAVGEDSGDLVALEPGAHADVVLYWQQWALGSQGLARVAEAVSRAAEETLR